MKYSHKILALIALALIIALGLIHYFYPLLGFVSAAGAQCGDGFDNDGDRLFDYPHDPGCTSAGDSLERDDPIAGTGQEVDCGVHVRDVSLIPVIAACVSSGPQPTVVTPKTGFDLSQGRFPVIVHISGDVYAIAYEGDDNDGTIKTVRITNSVIESISSNNEFDSSQGKTPSIVRVAGDIYAIAYQGPSNVGIIRTVRISSAGAVSGLPYLGTLTFDTGTVITPHLIRVSGSIYAIVYEGANNKGYIRTVSINATGTSISNISNFNFDAARTKNPKILNAGSSALDEVFAIAYEGSGSDGTIKTIRITTSGVIAPVVISSFVFDGTGITPDILRVQGDKFAIAYSGASGNQGVLKTLTINSTGMIGGIVDTLLFDPVSGLAPSIVHSMGDIYAITYEGSGNDGFIIAVSINSNGQIGDSVLSSYNFESGDIEISFAQKIKNAPGVFAVAYPSLAKGYLITLRPATPGLLAPASALRTLKMGALYYILLVPALDSKASRLRIQTPLGVQAIKLL